MIMGFADHQALLRWNDENRQTRAPTRNLSLPVNDLEVALVQLHPQLFELLADSAANVRSVPADSAAENPRGCAIRRSQLSAEILSHAVSEHFESKFRAINLRDGE
jgi:hypothetical protein